MVLAATIPSGSFKRGIVLKRNLKGRVILAATISRLFPLQCSFKGRIPIRIGRGGSVGSGGGAEWRLVLPVHVASSGAWTVPVRGAGGGAVGVRLEGRDAPLGKRWAACEASPRPCCGGAEGSGGGGATRLWGDALRSGAAVDVDDRMVDLWGRVRGGRGKGHIDGRLS